MAARKNDGVAGLVMGVLVIGVVLMLLIWPFYVGVTMVRGFGGDEESLAARIVGSLLEAVYLAIVAVVAIAMNRRKKLRAHATIRGLSAANLENEVRNQHGRVNLLEAVRLQLRSSPMGEPDPRIPAREVLLMELHNVHLVEPRVHERGWAPLPTYVRPGTLLVSDRALRHLSAQGKVEWRYDRIHEQHEGADGMVTWAVSNRQKVSGVGGAAAVVDAVKCLMTWAEEYPAEPARAEGMVDDLVRAAEGRLEDLQTEHASLTAAAAPSDAEIWSAPVAAVAGRPRALAAVVGVVAFVVALVVSAPDSSEVDRDRDRLSAAEDQGSTDRDGSGEGEIVTVNDGDGADKPKKPRPDPTYVVKRVVDGDTLVLRNGETVRLVGIDAPEVGRCGSVLAANALADLVEGREVRLGESDEDRDKYDRLLRYVDVRGVDAGLRLIKQGLAVARYDSRDGYGFHPRERDYIRTDRASADFECAVPPPPPAPKPPKPPKQFVDTSSNCASGYSPCIPSYPPDLDCADTGPVTVTGSDPHGLDADGDGVACGGD